ncbi:hypothetical protein LJ707_12310 [Mucilaginibacter sp. UR6-1]|uniref:hypothetical protein n=1 Tax=Mucilaginibacter sp. UR6-1 TaxID=1435643 RepID=UPI001E329C71|nr:hypothetical protein [Mucilaginibacter sp. UR6-1]MCC8409714.1 hypothetical protein [Mucilaginibacter sp. UR6-1]
MEKGMNMQDNELDDLFRNKLNGLEVEPSGNVWGNIVAGLDVDKKKKPLWAYISAAASVIIIATAGLLLMKQQEVKPENNTQRITKVQPAKKVADVTKPAEQPVLAQNTEKSSAPVTTPVEEMRNEHSKKEKSAPAKLARVRATPLKPIAGIKTKPILIAEVAQQPQQSISTPVLPDAAVTLSEKSISAEPEPFKTKPVIIASAGLPQMQKTIAEQPEKKKRRGLGGLLNAIVSKIDKRKDKIIEFEDNGDGQRLTGINLGIIKIETEEE